MDKNSFLSLHLNFLPFFNACILTVPTVGNTGRIVFLKPIPVCPKQKINSVAKLYFDSTKSCPKNGIALNKLVITVAKIYNIFVYSYPFSFKQ